MSVLTHSVKTLLSSTTFVRSFAVPNADIELVLAQHSRSVKTNQFYLYEKQDLSNRRVAERIPMYLKASIYGTTNKKVRFVFDDNRQVSSDILRKVEDAVLSHAEVFIKEKQAPAIALS